MFTRHRQGFRFHLAPFRNRFQIASVRVTFSHNFDPDRVNAKAFCDFLAPFSTRSADSSERGLFSHLSNVCMKSQNHVHSAQGFAFDKANLNWIVLKPNKAYRLSAWSLFTRLLSPNAITDWGWWWSLLQNEKWVSFTLKFTMAIITAWLMNKINSYRISPARNVYIQIKHLYS